MFENKAPIRTRPSCSEIVDMTETFANLRIPSIPQRKRLAPVEWRIGEQVKVEDLHLFKDRLVEPILDVWNIETDFDVKEQPIPHEMKVQEWLMKNLD